MAAPKNISCLIVALGLWSSAAFAADNLFFETSGSVSGDLRIFPKDALYDDQKDQHLNPSLAIEPEFLWEWSDGNDRIEFKPFLRLDAQDQQRTHADVRELKYLHIGEGWDLRAGFDKLFWGVTESRHLVDIINQTDAVEDVDGEDKLGQAMINFGLQQDWGNLNFIYMPYFRERTFPGRDGRLRAGTLVDTNQAVYQSDLGQWNPDLAVRYTKVLGDFDLGLSHFHGTSREARFVLGKSDSGDSVFIPHYDQIDQTGLDLQATIEEWLWKVEGAWRSGQGNSFGAVSAGVEYTLFGLINDIGDLGLLAEYHYDARDQDAPSTSYDNDIFVGARVTLNDEQDTDFLAGVLVDRFTQAQSWSAEFDRRLDDHWTIEGELRLARGLTDKDPSYGARKDDHLQIRLRRYF